MFDLIGLVLQVVLAVLVQVITRHSFVVKGIASILLLISAAVPHPYLLAPSFLVSLVGLYQRPGDWTAFIGTGGMVVTYGLRYSARNAVDEARGLEKLKYGAPEA
ncbi:hypothetical protein T439DRAFT_139638 [Meredithblackwellia eburnea MCA 4105]